MCTDTKPCFSHAWAGAVADPMDDDPSWCAVLERARALDGNPLCDGVEVVARCLRVYDPGFVRIAVRVDEAVLTVRLFAGSGSVPDSLGVPAAGDMLDAVLEGLHRAVFGEPGTRVTHSGRKTGLVVDLTDGRPLPMRIP